jgi:hypothetical protein
MRRLIIASLAATMLIGTAFVGTAGATAQKQKYVYDGLSGPDSSTCGGNWATDTFRRTFTAYTQQAIDGSYRVVETFTKGHFTTMQGPSPEACQAGTNNQVSTGLTGSMSGSEVIKVTNGTFPSPGPIVCPGDCTTTDWVHAAFGNGATGTVSDFYFFYKTSNRLACAKTWTNAATGNGGDIATICSP